MLLQAHGQFCQSQRKSSYPHLGGGEYQGMNHRGGDAFSVTHDIPNNVTVPSPFLSQKLLFPFHLEIVILLQFLSKKVHTLGYLEGVLLALLLFHSQLAPHLSLNSSHPTIATASWTSSLTSGGYHLHRSPSSQFLYLSKFGSYLALSKIPLRKFIWFPHP